MKKRFLLYPIWEPPDLVVMVMVVVMVVMVVMMVMVQVMVVTSSC